MNTQNLNSGFVAGTLVHTDKGLVSIQDVKVGDMVLSRDQNNPNGELVYKPVVRNIVTENVSVYFASFTPEALDDLPVWKLSDHSLYADMLCTANHPFWVENKGWINAEQLQRGNNVIVKDGSVARCIGGGFEGTDGIEAVFKTDQPNVGYIPDFHSNTNSGRFVNLDTGRTLYFGGYDPVFRKLFIEDTGWRERLLAQTPAEHREHAEFYSFRQGFWRDGAGIDWAEGEGPVITTVYELEVAENHTYFVGKQGIWVHD